MLLDVFDRVYVINLPARKDRRDEMEIQLRSVGASFDDHRVVLFPAIRPEDAGGFPSVGAHGCFMSHLGVLKDVRENSQSRNILILEDDCNFRKNFLDELPEISELFQSIDDLLFYGGEVGTKQLKSSVDIRRLMRIPSENGIMGSHCIGLHQKTAGKIVDYFEKMLGRESGSLEGGPMHVDGAYSWFRKENPDIETWMSNPECVFQRSSATDVHERKWFEKNNIIFGLMNILRKIKNWVDKK